MEIPCFGTTHADHFFGPCRSRGRSPKRKSTRPTKLNTGRVIVERFAELDPLAMPAVLVASHAPFAWGKDAAESVKNAVALEAVAEMALGVLQLEPRVHRLEQYVLDKHYDASTAKTPTTDNELMS